MQPLFAKEVQELLSAFEVWSTYRGPSNEFRKEHIDAANKTTTWPLYSQELLAEMKKFKPGGMEPWISNDENCYINPWGNASYVEWTRHLLNCMKHGPEGAKAAVEYLYPALLKHQELKAKYSTRERNEWSDKPFENLLDTLKQLYEHGELSPQSRVQLLKSKHHWEYGGSSNIIEMPPGTKELWDMAAQQTLDKANDLLSEHQGDPEQGLKLLIAFNQQIGAPFDNIIHDALQNPKWLADS
jgi:hypothetical protein